MTTYVKRDKPKIEDLTREQLITLATRQEEELTRLKKYRRNIRSAYSALQNAYDLKRFALMKALHKMKVILDISSVEEETVLDLTMKLDASRRLIGEQRLTIERLKNSKRRPEDRDVPDGNRTPSVEPTGELKTVQNG